MNFKSQNPVLMKKIVLISFSLGLIIMASCKKLVEKQEENIIVQAMTDGRWYVEQYLANTTDVTGDFLGYEFQFYSNGTVDGIKNTVTVSTGTWSGDVSNYTITANFPASASDTLKRLNYTWKLTDSYTNYVEAKVTTANGDNILHLRKK